MQGRVDDGIFGGRLRAGKVKSRLLEAHPPEPSPEGSEALLGSIAERAELRLDQLSDDLWAMVGGEDVFFVDALNPRFWLLHSTATTPRLRSLWRKHLVSSARLDSAWFSSDHLRQLEGELRWIKSSFNSDDLQPSGHGNDVPRRWRVQVEGEEPEELLNLVRNTKYEASASLTAVGSILFDEELGSATVAADYQGGFVSSGSSFEVVVGLLWRSLDQYEAYVRDLEDRFRIRTELVELPGGMALDFDGDVAHIQFPRPVEDVTTFVGNLFNCKEPFRLWAVPREVGVGQWEANAVDLHVGNTLRLEIAPEWMRVLLGEQTCGNTLARLLANFQHRFHAQTQLASTAA
jgi:hypothetical protein